MAEVRYREVYQSGQLVATEPYEVPDEVIGREQAWDKLKQLKAKGKPNWVHNQDTYDAIEALMTLAGF